MTKAGVLLAGLLLALGVLVPSASAATRTVHLTNDGPAPAALTLAPGDRVVFVNDDRVPHRVRSGSGWQFDSGPVPPNGTSGPTPALTAPGTYRYSDVRGIVVLPQTYQGRLVVRAPRPTPSPSRSPRPSPSAVPSATPGETPTPTPTSSASPTPSPSASPSLSPAATPSPSPAAASPSASPPAPPTDLRYGDPSALVQASPHRYGLPALLAGVAIGGVLSLLARYLLALPESRSATG
ncbi:MAG TPA: hypothetical protein VMZ11_08720 [Mycobacteriales bacterium]|nr:hypothetical protein [Mycobacteriales bacterium]